MPRPSPAVMKSASMASSFLTGPVGTGIAAGLGSLAGSQGQSNEDLRKMGRFNRDQQWELAKRQNKYIDSKRIQQTVRDAKKAGLHPLAALGIAPASSSAPAFTPAAPIPGQNETGSAISTGINAMLNTSASQAQRTHATGLQRLQTQEQVLRNEWLVSQIEASKVKSLTQLANVNRDALAIEAIKKPHKGTLVKGAELLPHTTDRHGYNLFGGMEIKQRPGKLTVEGAEDAMGEFGALLYSPFSILQDIGYTLDQKLRTTGSNPFRLPTNVGGPSP